MTEKRFTVHIKWFNYDKTEGEIELFDNGQPLLVSECIEDVQMIKELLNELNEKNQRLQKENKILYDENIQLRNKLLHFIQLKDDVKYLEEKGVF